MPRWILPLLISFCIFLPSAPTQEYVNIPEPVPIVANVGTDDALDHLFGLDPLLYLIVVGLLGAIATLTYSIKILWDRNQKLNTEKDSLNESRIKISMSTTEAITEAITLVQLINNGVGKLNDSEQSRRLVDVEIKNHLINISKDLESLKNEINKIR